MTFFVMTNNNFASVANSAVPACHQIFLTHEKISLPQMQYKIETEYKKFCDDMEIFITNLLQENPGLQLKHSHRFYTQNNLGILLPNGKSYMYLIKTSEDLALMNSNSDTAPEGGSLSFILQQLGLSFKNLTVPKLNEQYSIEKIRLINEKLLNETVSIESLKLKIISIKDGIEGLRKKYTPDEISLLEKEAHILLKKIEDTGTRRELELADLFIEKLRFFRKPSEDQIGYRNEIKQNLVNAIFGQAKSIGQELHYHGQPIWLTKSTIKEGELSSHALRSLIKDKETDCGVANICTNLLGRGGSAVQGEPLLYARKGEYFPYGSIFVMKGHPLDSYGGQTRTRNLHFSASNNDGRIVAILVDREILNEVRNWLRVHGINEHLAIEYIQYIEKWGKQE